MSDLTLPVSSPDAFPEAALLAGLQSVVDDHIIIAVTDRRGTIVRVNRAFARISGYSEAELIGQNHRILSSAVHSRDFWKQMWRTVASGNAWHGEVCNRAKDGSLYWVDTTIFPLKNAGGRIDGYLAIRIEMTDTERIRTALIDSLTGLPGRTFLMHRLRTLPERAAPSGAYAVCFIDLDNFKYVNDSLGHTTGDRLLQETARRLTVAMAPDGHANPFMPFDMDRGSFAARFGGDEFVLLLDDLTSVDEAVAVADRVRQQMSMPVVIDGHEITVHCSIGIAAGDAAQGYTSGDALLRDADTAMYQAKASGKNCYARFDEQMHTTVRRRLRLEGDLRNALSNGDVVGMYQPIVNLETGRVVSFEALARWRHPELGSISPAEFVPIAEESGLIIPMTEALLTDALELIARLNDDPAGRELRVNVNVSRRQLCNPGFAGFLQAALDRSGIDAGRLCLEITESAVTASPDQVREALHRLKQLGIQLHMDDFGTGLSSLSLLRTLPLDGIKIDRSFIETAEGDHEAIAILHAIITLGRNLRKIVTAEGLENGTHVATILALDCDLAQGWVFGAAAPASATRDMLARDFSAQIARATGMPNDGSAMRAPPLTRPAARFPCP